jgi:hypothetical protein
MNPREREFELDFRKKIKELQRKNTGPSNSVIIGEFRIMVFGEVITEVSLKYDSDC